MSEMINKRTVVDNGWLKLKIPLFFVLLSWLHWHFSLQS